MNQSHGNVFLAGVGGQGILLASEVLGDAFLIGGFDVKKSEVHGMAQRGGAVTTHLRFGPRVFSPLIEEGTADLLVAFEKMEALRFAHFLKPGGAAVVNAQEILPPSVAIGRERYPERIEERLAHVTPNLYLVDALAAALSLREVRAMNMVMVGAACHLLPLKVETIEDYIRHRFAKKGERVVETNLRAFRAGQEAAR